jgi:hypothetical protein
VTRRRVLLDENITVQLRLWMPRVDAASVEFMGWKAVKNGELLRRAVAGNVRGAGHCRPPARSDSALLDAACLRLSHLESDA